MKRILPAIRWLAIGLGAAVVGCVHPHCGGPDAEFGQGPACGNPPHSRFHPVPTRPVFATAATHAELPADSLAPTPPDLVPPELFEPLPTSDEPQRLPEVIARPIDERPSSRRR